MSRGVAKVKMTGIKQRGRKIRMHNLDDVRKRLRLSRKAGIQDRKQEAACLGRGKNARPTSGRR